MAAVAGAAAAAPALAQSPPAPGARLFDARLTTDAHYAQGEPSIAVNPRNPSNLVITFLKNTGFGAYGLQNGKGPTTLDFKQPIQACFALVTFNAGRTWTEHRLPLTRALSDRSNCSDTLVLFDKSGIAYVIGGTYEFPTFAAGQGDFRMVTSRDGGRSWSAPAVVSPTILSPHANPVAWKGLRFYDDREYLALDASTHTLYVNGTQGRADAHRSVGDTEYLTASQDGKTWSNAVAVGVAAPAPLGAAYGIVAFTSPPPMGAKRSCSCFDFIVSTDRAKTFVRRTSPVLGSSGLLSGAVTVADLSGADRFDVLTSDSNGRLLLYRTGDSGRTWSAPTSFGVAGRGVSKTWMAYSPSGVLGVGWRSTNGNGGYGFYGAVSYDHGATFTVHRISKQDSPSTDPLYVAGDDTSTVAMANGRFYASWGDWRGGSLQTWWGGFPVGR